VVEKCRLGPTQSIMLANSSERLGSTAQYWSQLVVDNVLTWGPRSSPRKHGFFGIPVLSVHVMRLIYISCPTGRIPILRL
jgi:hypothetical protein